MFDRLVRTNILLAPIMLVVYPVMYVIVRVFMLVFRIPTKAEALRKNVDAEIRAGVAKNWKKVTVESGTAEYKEAVIRSAVMHGLNVSRVNLTSREIALLERLQAKSRNNH